MSNEEQQSGEYQSMAFHPYNIILTLLLMGVISLFMAFSISYIYSSIQMNIPPVKLPPIFLFNTVILLASSAAMMWANRSYKEDHTENYQRALILTIVLSLVFLVAQYFGWKALFDNNVFINSTTTASYLYLISFLHFAHVIAGLPFLGLFLYVAYYRMKEPVSVLVYFSDPEKLLKLRLLTRYWHFLDLLWIYLVLFFYANYFLL